MEKHVLDRRLEQMRAEGTEFRTGVDVGGGRDRRRRALRAEYDAVLAGRRRAPPAATCRLPGRELAGIHQAMEYLDAGEPGAAGRPRAAADRRATGKHVVIIGGGDTGADCLGTAHRQGAASVHQLEILTRPPDTRDASTPGPPGRWCYRDAAAHEEGGERVFARAAPPASSATARARAAGAASTSRYEMVDGRFEKVPGTEFDLPCDLVLLAIGFSGPERPGLLDELGVELDRPRQRRPGRRTGRPACPASSWPGTWAAARASSSGRSPRAGPRRGRRRGLTGETLLPRR